MDNIIIVNNRARWNEDDNMVPLRRYLYMEFLLRPRLGGFDVDSALSEDIVMEFSNVFLFVLII